MTAETKSQIIGYINQTKDLDYQNRPWFLWSKPDDAKKAYDSMINNRE